MELGEAKRRCRDVIERIERLPAAISRRTLLKLAHSELSFLSRCSCTASTPLLSVNIGHLEAVVHILHLPSITAVSRVCKPLPLSSSSPPLLNLNVHVDIVCTLNRKPVWIIVSDRNPTSITWNHQSQPNKGLQFRLHQLTQAASSSAVSLRPSSLILFFSHGLTPFLSHKLIHEFSATPVHLPHSTFHFDLIEDANDWIHVLVPRTYQQASVFEIKLKHDDDAAAAAALCLQSHFKVSPMAAHWDSLDDTTLRFPAFTALLSKMHLFQTMKTGDSHVINFDTTALIALVSAISNGGTQKLLAAPETELRHRFKGNYDFVIGQVMSEIQNPILVELGSAISGKQGIICETVHSEFKELVLMYGGPNEKLRASHLLKHLRVVPDSPSKRMMSLPTTRKLALKCKVVFGTGDYWCAPTATANMAFMRAVSQAGMSLSTIEHGPRALTGD